ncbi:MAG: thiazole synthase [Capsulimonadaceae bacterium]|nr:thiazole synthase [Capsulimonadaceae bacterium]
MSVEALPKQGNEVTIGEQDFFEIGGKRFTSRLMLGTGKYRNGEEMNAALEASGTQIVTVALRRIDLDAPKRSILDEIDWSRYQILPNTAGAKTADEAIRTARLARAMGLSDWIKVEVIPDPKYLLPDPVGTFEACEVLVKEGFVVLPYINADPVLALRLQELGTATVMPLASPIGSGQGMKTMDSIRIIVEQARVPVVVDAGLGVPSEAALSMELGASACLINTAIARSDNPALMASAMRLGVKAGRTAYLAGRMPVLPFASASSPVTGVVR